MSAAITLWLAGKMWGTVLPRFGNCLSSQGYGFSCGHVWMWGLDCEEGWAPKYWCFWTVVLEKTLEGPLDYKEIQPVHSEGDQPWDFFGGNDAKAETPVLWPPHAKSWLIGKDADAGRDWGQEEKGTTEDELAGWHRWLDGHESEWTPGVGDGQGGLACCDSWGRRVGHDWATELNWRKVNVWELAGIACRVVRGGRPHWEPWHEGVRGQPYQSILGRGTCQCGNVKGRACWRVLELKGSQGRWSGEWQEGGSERSCGALEVIVNWESED